MERQLDIAQCDERERVLYAAGQLRGAALDWWESHRIQDREAFTWIQFWERFRMSTLGVVVLVLLALCFLPVEISSRVGAP